MLVDQDRTRNATNWWERGDGRMPFNVVSPTRMLSVAREHDHIVIDTRGGLEDKDLIEIYDDSDIVVIPASVESMTLEAMLATVDTLRKHNRGTDKVRVLVTRAERTSKRAVEARALIEEFGLTALTSTIRPTTAFLDAANLGVLVHQTRSPIGKLGWLDYERAFQEVVA